MISTDSFLRNGDTALWVLPPDETDKPHKVEAMRRYNRPCDTCDGTTRIYLRSPLETNCPDCDGSGRHTFNIEVEPPITSQGPLDKRNHIRTFRVHVSEVLPIVRYSLEAGPGQPFIKKLSSPYMSGENHCIVRPDTSPGEAELIQLPMPIAQPGKYVVVLEIH